MHIYYVHPQPVPGERPEAMQILQTVDALAALGCDVTLVTPATPSLDAAAILGRPLRARVRLSPLDVRPAWWWMKRSSQPFYRAACARMRMVRDCDAILVRNLKLAEQLLRLPQRPRLIFETHEVFARTFAEIHSRYNLRARVKLAILRAREGAVYRQADALAALTEWLIADLREDYGVTTQAVVVPDGVDMQLAEAAILPHRPDGPTRLLYLGSLHPWKGVSTLIAAMARIPDAHLRIAGGPSDRIAELRALAQSHGVFSRVEFLGHVVPADRFKVIAECDICLLPLSETSIGSRYTSPLKLFEYMALGKPIVSADVPAIRSVLTSGESALLVPPGDVAALAAAVRQLMEQPALATRLGEQVRQLAQQYSWQARAAALLRLAGGIPCAE
jgi:glycosyltransferase involved in cell wall biosynthesis